MTKTGDCCLLSSLLIFIVLLGCQSDSEQVHKLNLNANTSDAVVIQEGIDERGNPYMALSWQHLGIEATSRITKLSLPDTHESSSFPEQVDYFLEENLIEEETLALSAFSENEQDLDTFVFQTTGMEEITTTLLLCDGLIEVINVHKSRTEPVRQQQKLVSTFRCLN